MRIKNNIKTSYDKCITMLIKAKSTRDIPLNSRSILYDPNTLDHNELKFLDLRVYV
jgi:hypothetical protein